jgi:hypothetical protein
LGKLQVVVVGWESGSAQRFQAEGAFSNTFPVLPPVPYAPATLSKIRNIMSALFNHAIGHAWIQRNPITKVRASANG